MDMVDTPKKETRDMNVMELIEKISETIKIAVLNLWGTDRERTNIAINERAQKMRDISRLKDAIDNIGIAFRAMEMLTETKDMKVTNKNVKDIVSEMLDNDDESLTSVREYDSDSDDVSFYISDSD